MNDLPELMQELTRIMKRLYKLQGKLAKITLAEMDAERAERRASIDAELRAIQAQEAARLATMEEAKATLTAHARALLEQSNREND